MPEAVAKYSPFEPVIFFTPAGNSNFAVCVLVAEGAADGAEAVVLGVAVVELVLGVAVEELEAVEVEAAEDGADFEDSEADFETSEVDFEAAAGVVVAEDLAASLAKAGAATNAITAKASKNFFMCFSNK